MNIFTEEDAATDSKDEETKNNQSKQKEKENIKQSAEV